MRALVFEKDNSEPPSNFLTLNSKSTSTPAREMAPARQVEQGTFDNIVREAIDDFGLSPEEAVEDAIEQLKKTGITDFSNISTQLPLSDGDCNDSDAHQNGVSDDASLSALSSLRSAIEQRSESHILQAVQDLLSLISDPSGRITNAVEAVELCASALSVSVNELHLKAIAPCCQLVSALCAKDDANRHRFIVASTDGITALKQLVSKLSSFKSSSLSNSNSTSIEHPDSTRVASEYTLPALRAITAILRRNERAKRQFAAGDLPQHLIALFKHSAENCFEAPTAFSLVCLAIVQLLAAGGDGNDIDPRVGIAESFPRARMFTGEHVVTDSGLRPLTNGVDGNLISALTVAMSLILSRPYPDEDLANGKMKPYLSTLRDCLSVANGCAQSDDMCKTLDEGGVITACADILTRFGHMDVNITLVTMQLLGKLAQRDSCKTRIFESSMKIAQDSAAKWADDNEPIAAALCTLVAQLCLRRPDLARSVAVGGVAADITRLLRLHMDTRGLPRVGCYALRNICSRDDKARELVRKDGTAEQLLRAMMKKSTSNCDAAYYALKEMDVLSDSELRWDSRYGSRSLVLKSGEQRERN